MCKLPSDFKLMQMLLSPWLTEKKEALYPSFADNISAASAKPERRNTDMFVQAETAHDKPATESCS